MSLVLVDSSVWIAYFRGSGSVDRERLDALIDNNQICVNELILSEIAPSLIHKRELEVARLLQSLTAVRLEIDWEEIISFQTINLNNGLNNIGIPDLIIMQNALRNNLHLFSLDKHFRLLKKHHRLRLYLN